MPLVDPEVYLRHCPHPPDIDLIMQHCHKSLKWQKRCDQYIREMCECIRKMRFEIHRDEVKARSRLPRGDTEVGDLREALPDSLHETTDLDL